MSSLSLAYPMDELNENDQEIEEQRIPTPELSSIWEIFGSSNLVKKGLIKLIPIVEIVAFLALTLSGFLKHDLVK